LKTRFISANFYLVTTLICFNEIISSIFINFTANLYLSIKISGVLPGIARIGADKFTINQTFMAKSQATFMKKQLEKNKIKKKEDKEQRKLERQQNSAGGNMDDMMAYVNEFGEIVSTPPANFTQNQ
jgi:uncharacterized membrane protein (DUF106 family)